MSHLTILSTAPTGYSANKACLSYTDSKECAEQYAEWEMQRSFMGRTGIVTQYCWIRLRQSWSSASFARHHVKRILGKYGCQLHALCLIYQSPTNSQPHQQASYRRHEERQSFLTGRNLGHVS